MSWPQVALKELGIVNTGSTPSTTNLDFWANSGTPFVTPGELGSSTPIISAERNLTSQGMAVSRVAPPGAVLVCCIGSLGKTGIAGRHLVTNQQINWIDFNAGIVDARYGYYACTRLAPQMINMAPSTTVAIVNKTSFSKLEIPLPPLDEQKRIAAILDKADQLRQKRRQAIALLDSLTQSIFLEMFGDPVSNPKGWPSLTLGELLSDIQSGWSPVCLDRPAADDEWGVLKLSAVTSGKFKPSEQKALPLDLAPKIKIEVNKDDVLFTRKNTCELVAACAWVDDVRPKLMLSDLIFRLVIRDRRILTPAFLWATLSNRNFRIQVQQLAGGAAGSMPNISKERLRQVTLSLPSLADQNEFNERTVALRTQQKSLDSQLHKFEMLFSTLQQSLFQGRL